MKNEKPNLQAIASLDWGISFSFPTPETIVSVFVFLSVGICLGAQMFDPYISIIPGSGFNGTILSNYYLELAQREASNALMIIMTMATYTVAFAIPLLISFSLAASFENGLLETLISYPISRKTLLVTKAAIIVILLASSFFLTAVISIGAFYLGRIPVIELILFVIAFLAVCLSITSSAILLAVASKRVGISSVGGIGIWIAVLFISSTSAEFRLTDGILNPVQLIARYLNGAGELVTSLDMFAGLLGSLLLGLILLVVSVFVFEEVDV